MSSITRPMVNASPTGAGGQTVVLRPKLVTAPQGAQTIRQQIGVASAVGGQQLQGGGQKIILTQGGKPIGQIRRVIGPGGQVQHIVVSQGGQPQQQANSNASSANKIETTSGDTKPKENAKGRFSCKLCDKNYMFLKEHQRNIHGAPGPGCYGPWPAPYFD